MRSFLIRLLGGYTPENVKGMLNRELLAQRRLIQSDSDNRLKQHQLRTQLFVKDHLRVRDGHILKHGEKAGIIDTEFDVVICGNDVVIQEIKNCRNLIFAPFVDRGTVEIVNRRL